MGGGGGGLRHLLHTSIRASRNIQAEPFSFIFFLDKKTTFKYSIDLQFYAVIIEFFRSA